VKYTWKDWLLAFVLVVCFSLAVGGFAEVYHPAMPANPQAKYEPVWTGASP